MMSPSPSYKYRGLWLQTKPEDRTFAGIAYQKENETEVFFYIKSTRGFAPIQNKSLEDITEKDLPQYNGKQKKLIPDPIVIDWKEEFDFYEMTKKYF